MKPSLKWLRETGILILIVSLLFLPWYLDPSPEPGQSPAVTGIELISRNGWSTFVWIRVMAYGLILLAYAISRFPAHQWVGVIPFMAACLLFLYLHLVILLGDGMSRPVSSLEVFAGITALVGTTVNWVGLISLGAGIYFAMRRQE